MANEDNFMITELRGAKGETFQEDMIVQHLKISGAHSDGITSIELINENDAFITASFDCCCHIWSITTGQKLGSLLLGGDINWKLVFNM
jgi:WD40 repeat protein